MPPASTTTSITTTTTTTTAMSKSILSKHHLLSCSGSFVRMPTEYFQFSCFLLLLLLLFKMIFTSHKYYCKLLHLLHSNLCVESISTEERSVQYKRYMKHELNNQHTYVSIHNIHAHIYTRYRMEIVDTYKHIHCCLRFYY